MTKVIVTLLGGRRLQVDVPAEHKGRKLERSVYGAVRLHPNVPRTLSKDELDYVREREPKAELRVQKYAEAKRVKAADGKKPEAKAPSGRVRRVRNGK